MSLAMRSCGRRIVLDRPFHHHHHGIRFLFLFLYRLPARSHFANRTLDSSERANILNIESESIQYRQMVEELGENAQIDALQASKRLRTLSRPAKKFRGPASTNHVMRSLLLAAKRPLIGRGSTLANLIRTARTHAAIQAKRFSGRDFRASSCSASTRDE